MKDVSIEENDLKIKHLVFGFLIVTSSMPLFFLFLSSESAVPLIVFNFLFVSLIFPLNGSLATKISLLLMGNVIGFFWNQLFSLFVYTVVYYIGGSFNVLHMLLNPIVNLLWMVSFWSMSLSVLVSSKNER